jgi:translocation and assembly module TamB
VAVLCEFGAGVLMKKALKFLGTLLFASLIALGVAVWFLLTPGGMEMVTPLLSRQLREATGLDVEIERLRWVYPAGIKFDALRFSAEEQPALRVEGFSTRLSARRLVRGRIYVYFLRADSVQFWDWPAERGEKTADEEPDFQIPDLRTLFERVSLEKLDLPEIRILRPALEDPVKFAFSGGLLNGELMLHASGSPERFGPLEAQLRVRHSVSHDYGQELAFDSTLQVGEGGFEVQGTLSNEQILLDAEIRSFPLSLFGLAGVTDPAAEVKGRLSVSGSPANPKAELRLDLSGLKPDDSDLWDGPPASVRVRAGLGDGRGRLNFSLEDLPGDPLVLEADLPLQVSLIPFSVDLHENEPVSGKLTASSDLEGLSRLFVLDVFHRLTGRLDVNFELEGTPAAPRLSGGAKVVDGAYEHELTGIHLRNLAFTLSADRGRLRLDHFEAEDGRSGRLKMDGEVMLEPGRDLSFEAELTLQDFQAVRQDELDAVVNGTLRWTGGLENSELEGRLSLRPVEIRIPERLPHTVRTVEVVERFGDERDAAVQEPEARPPRHRLTLDVRLESSDRIFVRGRGLDSEWSASLRMRGDVREPVLTGELSVIRGRFLFFGRRLLVSRGQVFFDGAFPPDPVLDVVAELRAGGILGMLRVSGPASGPEFELDSTPPLPEDEILARLLFGRESARMTPWQALTLAQAVNSLRGGGSAFDVMGTTRRMLQVDQIEVRTDDEQEGGQTRLAVGRYLGDRIYLELERGAEAESGRARVEVELTPTLRLETQTGTEADSGIGLRWRWDY